MKQYIVVWEDATISPARVTANYGELAANGFIYRFVVDGESIWEGAARLIRYVEEVR